MTKDRGWYRPAGVIQLRLALPGSRRSRSHVMVNHRGTEATEDTEPSPRIGVHNNCLLLFFFVPFVPLVPSW